MQFKLSPVGSRNFGVLVCGGLLMLLSLGCNPEPDIADSDVAPAPVPESDVAIDSQRAALETPEAGTEAPPEPADSAVGLELISFADLHQKIVASDVPVVLDIWSTSCIPCMQEFPELVRVRDEHDRDSIRFISLNVDYIGLKKKEPSTYQSEAEDFLQRVGAGEIENYLSTTPDAEVFSELDIPSLPAVLVFEPGGKLHKKFVDVGETAEFTYATHVEPVIGEMLDES